MICLVKYFAAALKRCCEKCWHICYPYPKSTQVQNVDCSIVHSYQLGEYQFESAVESYLFNSLLGVVSRPFRPWFVYYIYPPSYRTKQKSDFKRKNISIIIKKKLLWTVILFLIDPQIIYISWGPFVTNVHKIWNFEWNQNTTRTFIATNDQFTWWFPKAHWCSFLNGSVCPELTESAVGRVALLQLISIYTME